MTGMYSQWTTWIGFDIKKNIYILMLYIKEFILRSLGASNVSAVWDQFQGKDSFKLRTIDGSLVRKELSRTMVGTRMVSFLITKNELIVIMLDKIQGWKDRNSKYNYWMGTGIITYYKQNKSLYDNLYSTHQLDNFTLSPFYLRCCNYCNYIFVLNLYLRN